MAYDNDPSFVETYYCVCACENTRYELGLNLFVAKVRNSVACLAWYMGIIFKQYLIARENCDMKHMLQKRLIINGWGGKLLEWH